jgi:hypothetical protein
MNDVVNMSISSEFSVNLMNELSSDPTISPEQKRSLRAALLSHQAYSALNVGTMQELKNVYNTFANMEDIKKERDFLQTKYFCTHYKTKAKAAKTLDAYEMNFNVKGYVNSAEVYLLTIFTLLIVVLCKLVIILMLKLLN